MNYDQKIEILMNVANEVGYPVTLNSEKIIDNDCYGHVNFNTREIHIGSNITKFQIIITLCHELGHVIGHSRAIEMHGNYAFTNHHALLEMDAYRFGWVINRKFGIGTDKKTWRKNHKSEIVAFVKKYGKSPIICPSTRIPEPLKFGDYLGMAFLSLLILATIASILTN